MSHQKESGALGMRFLAFFNNKFHFFLIRAKALTHRLGNGTLSVFGLGKEAMDLGRRVVLILKGWAELWPNGP